ncbi:MAG: Unknown protein [uncultured Sulfurovum sp.]|uniref:Type II secretion system protein n=1 Tax=uncultured Sulfurovum sp. TaxID=269237 RepID=A0A6S6TZ33_9BACT|nr:MAG: Unknown protein [uncultured Sulfurovum sp.]
MKKAFSLLEVIFVLVILGIVASLSSQIIIQVYENYLMQRAVYNVSTKTELVANQIVNRLTYRIQGSTISKKHQDFLDGNATATSWLPLRDIPTGESFTSIEWIGYDNDSFSATKNPSWNGIANYENHASILEFTTPDSNLSITANIMNNLSNGKVNLTSANPAAVLFAQDDNYYTDTIEYNPLCMGLIPEVLASTSCIFPVMRNGTEKLTFTRTQDPNNAILLPKIITERYKLAWSAYALAPEFDATTNQYNLFLYSNYQPWNGESYMSQDVEKNILLPNITVFKFSENGGVINFKLCASENIGEDFNVTTCKQKVVIR